MKLWKWQKMGRIYHRDEGPFFKSHAMRVVPFDLPDGNLRLFFSSRCAEDTYHLTFIDVDPENQFRPIYVHEEPVLDIGAPGLFDDSGTTLISIQKIGDEYLGYYTGWKRRRVVTFEYSIGAGRFNRDFTKIEKVSDGPIIGQSRDNPYLAAGPFVRPNIKNQLTMWYCSGTKWIDQPHGQEPIYSIAAAKSQDGINWDTSDCHQLIPFKFDGEVISGPWIEIAQEGYVMYYCYRGSASREEKNYQIGVATSPDGRNWIRRDEDVGIERSEDGWDSIMICYPAIYHRNGRTFMFYCGNAHGRDGIGYALAV